MGQPEGESASSDHGISVSLSLHLIQLLPYSTSMRLAFILPLVAAARSIAIQPATRCPDSLTACPGGSGLVECVDVQSDMEMCGGCSFDVSFLRMYGAPRP